MNTSGGTASIVIPTLPSVGVSSSSPTSQYKQPVTFTATVGPNGSGGPVPTGSVTFTVDGVAQPAVPLAAGKATMPLAGLAAGTHQITAAYSGDANYLGATSAALTQVISPGGTTTTLTTAQNPVQQGGAGAITAKVKDVLAITGPPTGTITFTVDGVSRAPVSLNATGVARLALSKLAAGSDTVTATYNGDTSHAVSTSAQLVEVVSPPAPMIRAPGGTWGGLTG